MFYRASRTDHMRGEGCVPTLKIPQAWSCHGYTIVWQLHQRTVPCATNGQFPTQHPNRNQVSFDSAKCRWILQSKSALSGWCGTVSSLWHNIIWNDIEQHAFGTKLLAGFSFDSSKFIALIPRSFNPLWHKLRLAFVEGKGGNPPLHSFFLYLKLLLTIYAHTSDAHFEWQKERGKKDLLE